MPATCIRTSMDSDRMSVPLAEEDYSDRDLIENSRSVEESLEGHLTERALFLASAQEHSLTSLQAIRTYWRAFLWSVFISIGAILWGFDAQVGGAVLAIPAFRRDFGYVVNGQFVISAGWQSGFNGASSIGGMLGGLSIGYVAERFGRRGSIILCSFISIGAVFIQFLTPPHQNGLLLIGKLINGCALGMYVSSASSYCAEVSPLPLRGVTTGSVNLWLVFGQLISSCVIQAMGTRTDTYAYRIPFACQWIFPAILLVGIIFAPESPWWLVHKGRLGDARMVVERLSGTAIDAQLQVQRIKETIELEEKTAERAAYTDLFKGIDKRRTIIASMVFVLQQLSGVVFMLGFCTYFFELAGFPDSDAFRLGVGVSAIGIAGNLVAAYMVNRFGRRFLFNWGMVACTIVNFLVGLLALPNTAASNWAMAAFTVVYSFVYQAAIGPVCYVIFAEVSSARLRTKTVGFGIVINSLCGMVSNIVIPHLVNPDEANLGGKVGLIFGVLSVIGTIWAWLYIPETKDRTVDELDALFDLKISAPEFSSYNLDEGRGAERTRLLNEP